MTTQEAVSSIVISGMGLALLIVLIVNVRGCAESETKAMLDSGHTLDASGRWVKP